MTTQLYYEDPALERFSAEVERVTVLRGTTVAVILGQTAFFPEGGGQPSDQGVIRGPAGEVAVKIVRTQDDAIVHEGNLTGQLTPGDPVECEVKWHRRIKYMRVHSAGHLIHDVLVSQEPDLVPVKGRHGDKAFLEYRGALTEDLAERLGGLVNEEAGRDLPIRSWETSLEELEQLSATLPANLPRGKALRAIKIGDFTPMPDGGVHVGSTAQIGDILIHHITADGNHFIVRYGVR